MTVITTVPNVSYFAYTVRGEKLNINNPSDLPDPTMIDHVEEPYIKANIITKTEFVGCYYGLYASKKEVQL